MRILAVMPISSQQLRHLRKLAHHLKVIIIIGQHGLGENVLNEIEQALEYHELVKVRVNAADRSERNTIIDSISQQTRSDVIQRIGHIAVFYRRSDEVKITLPKS